MLGSSLFNTGSSGRGTNTPGDYDFDLMLLIDPQDFAKVNDIKTRLLEKLKPKQDKSHGSSSGYIQIRALQSENLTDQDSNPLDIDIGLDKSSSMHEFGSHEAIEAKLNYVKQHYGDEVYLEVIANIILAKEVLKAGEAYKKADHGGFGGIGTETWVLANNGNFQDACTSFWQAAHTDYGSVVTFEEFKKKYPLYDPGINLKLATQSSKFQHDNYIANMTEEGYNAMLRAIEPFVRR